MILDKQLSPACLTRLLPFSPIKCILGPPDLQGCAELAGPGLMGVEYTGLGMGAREGRVSLTRS